ncbi:amidohydrolase family protein [Lichenicoccus sp.]|uniref:amidohydrolase family protein n=1 Tax=Lichenicoccus sp. TaxID=2781899 RepID=UPI003D13412B
MDTQGADTQVLSLTIPRVQNLAPADAVTVTREANDALAEIVNHNPARFQAFAAIPTPEPDSAGEELRRAVARLGFRGAMLYGRTGTTNADDRRFDGLYATADFIRLFTCIRKRPSRRSARPIIPDTATRSMPCWRTSVSAGITRPAFSCCA